MTGTLTRLTAIGALALLAASIARADGPDDPPASAENTPYTQALAAVRDERFEEAVVLLQEAAEADGDNADVQNLLGFSYRQQGQVVLAFEHYNRALRLDPKHIDAHEYIGELYLQQGDVASAEKHLKAIKKTFACFFGCDEYDELARAIEAHRRKSG